MRRHTFSAENMPGWQNAVHATTSTLYLFLCKSWNFSRQRIKDSLHMNILTMDGDEYRPFLEIPKKMPRKQE